MRPTPIFPVYSDVDVFEQTYRLVKEITGKGAIVECGVAAGSNFAQMIKASMDAGIDRDYYGFDSFEGIPYATEEDSTQPGLIVIDKTKFGLLESTGVSAHCKRDVITNLNQWGVWNDKVHLIEGWFQDTIPVNTIESISVLRLDGDLYASTKICLEYLYDKVEQGGLIIIDDYHLSGCRKAVNEFIEGKGIELKHFSYTVYWHK